MAVSGGADSVCLLRLAAGRPDLHLHVLHLDHQTRGEASAGDARFVAELATASKLPITLARRSDIEASVSVADCARLSANRSSRYRALRLELYRRAVADHHLQGVLLAHHADDQAETILLRLIRGGPAAALAGMTEQSTVQGVTLLRPLLTIPRSMLRDYLQQIGQPWREDASNASDNQARNRVRKVLADRPQLTQSLLEVGSCCRRLHEWVERSAPRLEKTFPVRALWDVPEILAAAAVGKWLREQGAPAGDLSADTLKSVLTLCRDAASPARLVAPGELTIRRRNGMIFREGRAADRLPDS